LNNAIKIIFTGLAILALSLSSLSAADSLVEKLQDSFDQTGANRRQTYAAVIAAVDAEGGTAGRDHILVRAVALNQRAMDLEDDFIDQLVAAAPAFGRLPISNPPFLSDYRRAAEAFAGLRSELPFLNPYADNARLISERWSDGRSLLEAALEFKTRYPASRFWRRLLLLAGCRMAARGDWDLARQAFDPLLNEAPTSSQAIDSYRLAWALKGTGKPDVPPARMLDWARGLGGAGRVVYTRLLDTWPDSPEAETAALESARLLHDGFPVRALSANILQADKLDRACEEFAARYPTSPSLPEFLRLRADFLYQCGKKSMAISRKNDYAWRKYGGKSRRSTAQKYKALADEHFGKVQRLAAQIDEKYHGSASYFQVGILEALGLIEQDRFDQALQRLNHLAAERPDSESVNQIYWYIALADYLKFDYVAVTQNLGPLESVSRRDPLYWSRAMLFLGKARLTLGDTQGALRAFNALAGAYPYTYYGIRARAIRAGMKLPAPLDPSAVPPSTDSPKFPQEYTSLGADIQKTAAAWRALGFYAEAAYIYNNGMNLVPQDDLLRFRMHENLYQAGWYHRVLRGFRGPFRDYLQRGGEGLPSGFWQIAFLEPEPYRRFIEASGRKSGLPSALVTAVMRQESNFHPRAKSHAGAVGLMQLLPSVGRRLGRKAGYGTVSAARLLDPEINIALGTRFLASNLKNYDGNIALAISSYNADPRNLPAWIERSHGDRASDFDLDLFIELIPLDETYDYNLQVLTNFWRYQEVYGGNGDLFKWKL